MSYDFKTDRIGESSEYMRDGRSIPPQAAFATVILSVAAVASLAISLIAPLVNLLRALNEGP